MRGLLRGLAIAALLVTVTGAGVVLYGLSTMEPRVVQVSVTATPAQQAQETFDTVLAQLDDGTFAGTQFSGADGLDAQGCTFLTYTVRLENRGFFTAEWVSLAIEPQQDAEGSDVLQIGGDGAHMLAAGTSGDLSATVLRAGDAGNTARSLSVTCYVFGQRITVQAGAE